MTFYICSFRSHAGASSSRKSGTEHSSISRHFLKVKLGINIFEKIHLPLSLFPLIMLSVDDIYPSTVSFILSFIFISPNLCLSHFHLTFYRSILLFRLLRASSYSSITIVHGYPHSYLCKIYNYSNPNVQSSLLPN